MQCCDVEQEGGHWGWSLIYVESTVQCCDVEHGDGGVVVPNICEKHGAVL